MSEIRSIFIQTKRQLTGEIDQINWVSILGTRGSPAGTGLIPHLYSQQRDTKVSRHLFLLYIDYSNVNTDVQTNFGSFGTFLATRCDPIAHPPGLGYKLGYQSLRVQAVT